MTTNSTNRCIPVIAVMILIAGTFLLGATVIRAETVAARDFITLKVTNEPLSVALNTIANSSGYRILVDPQWSGSRVSASFDHVALEKGLKRLLKDFDHAIVFESDRTIRIIIYGKTGASAGASPGHPYLPVPEEEIGSAPETERPVLPESSAELKNPPLPDADTPSDAAVSDADAEPVPAEEDAQAAGDNVQGDRSGKAD
jgi:hypothetical protein